MPTPPHVPKNRYAALAAGIVVLTVVILLLIGRTPWGPTGEPGFWSGGVESPHNSQRLADPYTFTHVTHGIGFYLILALVFAGRLPLGTLFLLAVLLESGWEILENTDLVIDRYREATIAIGYYGDSVLNSVGDILVTMFGFALAARLPVWFSILAFLLIEIVLAVLIRDNLILNVVMLIYPIPAVQIWQAGG